MEWILYSTIVMVGLLFCLPFIMRWSIKEASFYPKGRALIFGHRGSPAQITENTIPSFQKAIDQGVDGLEFDIRLAKDGVIMVFHDADLDRLSGNSAKVCALTSTELQAISLCKQEGQDIETRIPTLHEMVSILEQTQVANIEIKSEGVFDGHNIIKPLIAFLNTHHLDHKCIISSFNPLILLKIRLQRPQTMIGYLYKRGGWFHGWHNVIWMTRVRPDALHIHYSLLDSWVVRWARNKGMRINSYTINDKKVLDSADIDGVFTDNIEYLK